MKLIKALWKDGKVYYCPKDCLPGSRFCEQRKCGIARTCGRQVKVQAYHAVQIDNHKVKTGIAFFS